MNEGIDSMQSYVNRLAVTGAVGGALLAAILGTLQEVSVPSLILRSAVAAAVIYGFVRFGGELAGKALLRGLAEHQLKREEEAHRASSAESSNSEERRAA